MATPFKWAKLILENSKHLISVYVLLVGVTGYTLYGKVTEPSIVKVETPEVVKVEPKQVVRKNPLVKKVMADHVEEFH